MGDRAVAGKAFAADRFDRAIDQRHALGAQFDVAAGEAGDVVGFAAPVAPGELVLVVVEVVDGDHRLIDQATVEPLAGVGRTHRRRSTLRRGDEVVDGLDLTQDARRGHEAHRRGVAVDVEQHLAVVDDRVDVAVAHGEHAEVPEVLDGVAEALALGVLTRVERQVLVAAGALFDAIEQLRGEHLATWLFEGREDEREVHVAPSRHRSAIREPGAAMRTE